MRNVSWIVRTKLPVYTARVWFLAKDDGDAVRGVLKSPQLSGLDEEIVSDHAS